jgi:O-antigen/teichoic acid export membrane protein
LTDYENESAPRGGSPGSGPEEPAVDSQKSALKTLDHIFVRGVAWTAGVKWLTQLLTWGITIVVARLLSPSDYGLVGMATIYITLFTLFSEFGIGSAVVTLQDLTENQISQLNTLAVFIGFLGFMISAAAAIPLGKFFHAPNLPLVVVVLSCGFIVSGVRTVPYSLLQRELRFKLLAVIEGLQGIVQALITLLFAIWGFGYWALVLGILSFSVTPTGLVLMWRRAGFAVPQFSSIRRAVHYSRHILIGRLCWASYDNSDFIIAGRVLGEAPLGAYTLAWTLANTPLEKLTTLINRVTPSIFATIQSDFDALRRYVRNITGAMALIVFPATIGMALIAPDFVRIVLGAKWRGVVGPLELLALHALVRSNVILLTPALNVIGEERLVMRNSVVAMIVLPISFYLGSRWGTLGIAGMWVFVYPFLMMPLFLRIFRKIKMPLGEYAGALWPALSSCSMMAVVVEAVRHVLSVGRFPYFDLALEIVAGALVYVLAIALMHRERMRAFAGLINSLRRRPA